MYVYVCVYMNLAIVQHSKSVKGKERCANVDQIDEELFLIPAPGNVGGLDDACTIQMQTQTSDVFNERQSGNDAGQRCH